MTVTLRAVNPLSLSSPQTTRTVHKPAAPGLHDSTGGRVGNINQTDTVNLPDEPKNGTWVHGCELPRLPATGCHGGRSLTL